MSPESSGFLDSPSIAIGNAQLPIEDTDIGHLVTRIVPTGFPNAGALPSAVCLDEMSPTLVRTAPPKPFSTGRLILGLAGIAAVTFVFSRLLPVNASTVGFLFLIVVLGAAATSGFRVAALVSLAGMLCLNFSFLPPVGRLTIADPANWVALFTFLITALVASHLSDRIQKQAAEARRAQQETEQLYSLSRAILMTESSRPIGTQAAQSIAQIFSSPAVVILDAKSGQRYIGGSGEAGDWQRGLEEAVRIGNHHSDPAAGLDIWPISLGGNPVGALAATGLRISDGAAQSMLNLVAIALERVRTEEAAQRAEVARRSEEFKSTLLDAIAHEFKTPLTSIMAAVTGLRALGPERGADRQELASIIEEETGRLNQLVTEAVKMAEIDARKVKLNRVPVPSRELLLEARGNFEGRGAERIAILDESSRTVQADRDLMTLAIRQVLDNALKYGDAGSVVRCRTELAPDSVSLRIENDGPGISERDRERIFDKFHRRTTTRDQVPGSGLGLHIAREIARMHGGDLWVEPGNSRGAAFCFRLPSGTQAP